MRVSITDQSYSLLLQGTAEEHAKILGALAAGGTALNKGKDEISKAQGELLMVLHDAFASAVPGEEATP